MRLARQKIDPERVDLEDIRELEQWIEEAIRDAIQTSQKVAAEKMQPMMGALGGLGL